jgi:vitamin B12 transporter
MQAFSRRHKTVGTGLGVLIWALSCYGSGYAEDQAEQTEEHEIRTAEVVVSPTKTPIPTSHVTSAVEVITEEDLKRQKFKTVVDALRLSQGLAVFSSGGPGTEASVRIRGGSPAQTLVLIDGAIVNSATTGAYNFANLTIDNIERIEILRGAQSMLWGSDAMGGVINIVTKRGTGIPQASGFFEYGSFLSIREGGQVTGQKGPVDFSLSLSRWDFTGFSATNYRRGAFERDAYRNWQASSKLGVLLPHDGRLEFAFRWLNSDVHLDNVTTPTDVFGSKTRDQELVYSGSYEQAITSWWSQKLTLAREEDQSFFFPGILQRNVVTGAVNTPFGGPNEIRTVSNRIEAQHNFQIGKPLLLTGGYQLRDQQGENDTGLANKIIRSNAGFGQAQLNAWDRLLATAGVRYDSYNVFGSATTYRLTAGYLLTETGTKVRTSYGTGFRAPSINELFFPGFGNPNLGPEKSQSFDVGVDQSFLDDRVRLSAGYFWNNYRDLIVTSLNDPACATLSPLFLTCPRNVGSAKTRGWEAGISLSLLRDKRFVKSLELRGQYTYTLTRDLTSNFRLPRWPLDQWSAILAYQPIDPLSITLAARYVGSRFNNLLNTQRLPAFDVWTLTAAYDVTKQVQVYARVDNVFNEKYEEILNAGTPIQSIYVGLRVAYDLKREGKRA